MSVRHLEHLLAPDSVAVIGASPRAGSVGAVAWRRLREGGFGGPLYPVNLRHAQLDGVKVWRRVADLPRAPSLALVCTPPATVPGLVRQLGERGTRAVIVLTRGLAPATRQAVLDAARPHTLRILGPGSLGLLVPHLGLDASIAHIGARPGDIAFVSQSGTLVTAMLDWADARGIGFSHVVSLGDSADADIGDLLDFLGGDPRTRAILLYATGVGDSHKFMSAARAAARGKPVIMVKAGCAAGADANAAVDPDAVFDAAIARAGMLRVRTLQDLFLAAETLTRFDDGLSERLVVLGNGAGAGALAADEAAALGMPLAPLDEDIRERLAGALPGAGAPANPVDLGGDAPPGRYAAAIEAVMQDSGNALLLVHAPSALVPSADIARAVLPLVQAGPRRVLGCWLGERAVAEARQVFREGGVPDFDTPEAAVRAFGFLRAHRRHQAELLETPPARGAARAPDLPDLRAIVEQALASAQPDLGANETSALLAAAGLPVPPPIADAGTAPGQPARPPLRHACRVGARIDPVFGPVVVLDDGGPAPDGPADQALSLPPLNRPLALAQVRRSRLHRRPPGDTDALADWLVAVSQLLVDVPELAELDIHLLLDGQGRATVREARARLSAQRPAGAANFPIRPYPAELVETVDWRGQPLTLRPIRPEDEAQHRAFLERMAPEDIRLRVFHVRHSIGHAELARLTQIDYAREMAFVATRALPGGGGEETLGAVRVTVDPDNDTAEFGVLVRSDLQGGGLGRRLMRKMIGYLRGRGTRRLVGTVLRENTGMLELARALGFQEEGCAGDGHGQCRIALDLGTCRASGRPGDPP